MGITKNGSYKNSSMNAPGATGKLGTIISVMSVETAHRNSLEARMSNEYKLDLVMQIGLKCKNIIVKNDEKKQLKHTAADFCRMYSDQLSLAVIMLLQTDEAYSED